LWQRWQRFGSSSWAPIGVMLALAIAVLMPARADAFGTFANGVLTVSGGEGENSPPLRERWRDHRQRRFRRQRSCLLS
jgi:hypothetical protein